MKTPIVKSIIDEQVSSLEAAFKLPRETLVHSLPSPIKGNWKTPLDEPGVYMLGNFGFDPRGRLVLR